MRENYEKMSDEYLIKFIQAEKDKKELEIRIVRSPWKKN
jgi:uncharacterized protein YeeX (DUF496 family)